MRTEEEVVHHSDIEQLRALLELEPSPEAAPEEVRKVDEVLATVIATTGDVELAATAIAMRPRPEWVRDLIGDVIG